VPADAEPGTKAPVALFELRDVRTAFGSTVLFDGLDLDIHRGEVITLIGASGSGKSVLLKSILGLIPIDGGSISFDGQEVANRPEASMFEVRRRIGMLFQESALFDSMNVYGNVAYALEERRILGADAMKQRVADSLTVVGLGGIEAMWPASLSGGMKKRVSLARAIADQPEVVFYDEPTEGLDPINVTRINRLMLGLRRTMDVTTVVVTHNLRSALTISDRLAMLYEGKVILVGTPQEFAATEDPRVLAFIGGTLEAMREIGEEVGSGKA
jgi:phospholipid/cholesterol/gamma-HCH transport system ATP-binding protein